MQPSAPPQGVTAPAGGFQNGGWYGGQQYWNGQFGTAGQIINPNQQGSGGQVSNTVVAQTNPNNVAYLAGKNGANNGATTSGSLPTPSSVLGGGFNLGAPVAPNLTGLYDLYYTNNPDTIAGNKTITDLQSQIDARKTALETATKDVNDNPYYAEATRVGKINQLNSEAQNDINTLTGQLTTAQTAISKVQADAQIKVNLAQGQYTLANDAWKQNLDEFNTLISQGALENASPQTINGLSVSLGIPADMLSSIVSSEQAKNIQLITGTNGIVSGINAKTGQVVFNSQVGAASGSGSGGKLTKSEETAQNYQGLLQDVSAGITLKSLVDKYAVPGSGITYQDVYSAYASQNYGQPGSKTATGFGTPKETLAQVKAGQYADMPGFQPKPIKPAIQ